MIGKAGAEFFVCAFRRVHRHRIAQRARRRDLDQFRGDFADALLHARAARLPGGAAQPVKLHIQFVRAVTRQQFDILDRQVKLVIPVIDKQQTIMRGAIDIKRLKPAIAADTVIDMHDQIAHGEA